MELCPALRAAMGDWEYYVTIMKFGEIAHRVKYAHELEPHAELDAQIQRTLDQRVRVNDMVKYLQMQPQHFYGALIIAVYGGEPQFSHVKMAEHPLLDDSDTSFGMLRFDGNQQYFALDGQHRLASIRAAMKDKPELQTEEVCVILVPHRKSPEGLERTRRLFTTVNRHAQPTSPGVNIIMDEDDGFAIVTRWLVRDYQLFKGSRVKLQGASIPNRNRTAITTLDTLYKISGIVLPELVGKLEFTKQDMQFRPDDQTLSELKIAIEQYWSDVCDVIPEYAKVLADKAEPGDYRGDRDEGPGHLLFRPIGQLIFATVIATAAAHDTNTKMVMTLLAKLNWKLDALPWQGVVFRAGKMQTTKEVQSLATQLACYMVRVGDVNENELRDTYREWLEDNKASLPSQVVI